MSEGRSMEPASNVDAARHSVRRSFDEAMNALEASPLGRVTRSEGPFGFGANIDYARPGGVTIALTLNASFARDPRSARWRSQARSLAGLGGVSPLVYLDANGNGVRDADEKPLEGVGFYANRASTEARTSPEGTTLLTGLPPYQEVDVAIAAATLEDPLAIPERPGVRFVPRPGRATEVEFPILISGEVTGTVRLERGEEKHEASGVIVQLVDLQGSVAKEVRTAYDGFYDITLIVPGQYDIRMSPRQAERLKLKPPAPQRITILPSGTILDGIDILVEGQALATEAR